MFCLGYWSPYVLGRCCIGRLFTWVGKKCLVYGWAMDHLCRLHQTWWEVKSKSVLQLLQNKLLAINYWLLALCQGICWSSESDTLKFQLKPCLHPSHPLPTFFTFFSFLQYLLTVQYQWGVIVISTYALLPPFEKWWAVSPLQLCSLQTISNAFKFTLGRDGFIILSHWEQWFQAEVMLCNWKATSFFHK